MTENEIIRRVEKKLRKIGATQTTIDFMLDKVRNACLACKFGEKCFRERKVSPYQPKCDKHEYMEEIKV